MELAIKAARKCRGDPKNPKVGAVAVVGGRELRTAFRGEIEPNQHAEYVLLEEHLYDETVGWSNNLHNARAMY